MESSMAVIDSSAPTTISPPIPSQVAQSETWDWSSYLSLNESILLHLDGTAVTEKVIGQGGTGIVVEQGQYALKLPRISRYTKIDGVPVEVGSLTPKEGDYDERPPLIESIQTEKAIYKRLGDHYGIVRCYNLSSNDVSIQMDLMKYDLRHYLEEKRPDRKTQLSWLTTIAHTIAYIHEHRVLIADIRLDNLLLDGTGAVKFCDFSESALMPLDWDLSGTDDLGFSILTDIGQFGAVMYEIITGLKSRFHLRQERKGHEDLYVCPPRDSLPSTENIWLGYLIEKCWTQSFQSAEELATELDREREALEF
ncbi:hypothetical protein ABEF92_001225 [Exophiala dermatitidis]|uniref:Protein kinase domain-containing protein n=1 Tax=Exophiala dermatitidis (strain ATCC 34100 / CBS 525.76 / NIH/UT8656) TaxID=858893 RepID=H6C983_EXODN|nr:uncharacterized protein HMPREF1120_08611 [Exophiala dermatitidis NIH/UT8656]EHY60660.1 hypothetical protein HMPREF1120_08611 [Exophiala dermatitidis NIH/UT8656]